MIWLVGIVIGLAVGAGALHWALGSHRKERQPWLDLLSVNAIDGVAEDGGGSIPPITAPFTGRPCLGFALEIIVEEQHGNQTTWHRVFTDGAGQLFVRGRHVDLSGAGTVFPTPLENYGKYSSSLTNETVYNGTIDRAPPHIIAFVQHLDHETQAMIWRPSGMLVGGKRVYFNERIVLPGQPVVVAGDGPVAIAHGTVASERARVAKLPVGGELFGAVMGGVMACAFVNMILAMTGLLK